MNIFELGPRNIMPYITEIMFYNSFHNLLKNHLKVIKIHEFIIT